MRRAYLAGGIAAAVYGAILGVAFWPITPVVPTPTRPLLSSLDMRQPAYIGRHAQAWLTKPAAATTMLHCPLSDLGQKAQCVDQAGTWTELTATGTPVYGVRTPIVAKGQGRKGWYFDYSVPEYARASSSGLVSFGTTSGLTIEAVAQITAAPGTSQLIATTQDAGTASSRGASLFYADSGTLYCQINGNGTSQQIGGVSWANDYKVHHFACVKTYTSNWTTAIYVDGQSITVVDSGTSANNDITSSQAFTIGANSGGTAYGMGGAIYEVKLSNIARDSAYVKAAYRQSIYQGTYWATDANTIFLARFNEAVGATSLLDYSGGSKHLTVLGGSPDRQYGAPPFPMGSGFSRRGVWFNGTSAYLAATGNTIGDQTTNNFSVSFWINSMNGAGDHYIVDKRTGNYGWSVRTVNTNTVYIYLGNGTVLANGAVSGLLSAGWHFVTVGFDRAATATAHVDGVASGVTVDLTTVSGSVSSATPLTIGAFSGGGAYFTGAVSEIMVSNGLTTLAEHQAMYRAFKAPTGVTYAQASTRKFSLPPEDGFGERLGVFAGSTTSPQWPVEHAPRLKSTRTNVLGYTNEFNSWTKTSTTVVEDSVVGPLGGLTAARATQSSGGYINKAPVGGGSVAAGDRWCVSIYLKRVSGGCDRFYIGVDTGATPVLGNTNPAWTRLSYCGGSAGSTRGLYVCGTTAASGAGCATDCVYDLAEAQYERDQVTAACTSTTGNVIQTCDDGTNTLGLGFPAWGSTTNYSPLTNEFNSWTLSGVTVSANADEAPDGSMTADRATFSANGQYLTATYVGGGTIAAGERWVASIYYKRISGTCVGIQLWAENTGAPAVNLTDTSTWTRVSVASTTTGNVKEIAIYAVTHGSCVIALADAQYEANNLTPPCTSTTGNVSQVCDQSSPRPAVSLATMPTSLERGELVVTAAVAPYAHQPTTPRRLVRAGDTTAVLDEGVQPRFVLNGLGGYQDAVAKGRPIGSEAERREYVASWDYRDGLPATGVTHWSWGFNRTTPDYVAASSTSVADIGSATAFTAEALIRNTGSTSGTIASTTNVGAATASGWYLAWISSNQFRCAVFDTDVDYAYADTSAVFFYDGSPVHVACVADRTSGSWVVKLYVNGVQNGTQTDVGTPTGPAPNAYALRVAQSAAGTSVPYSGQIYEVRVLTRALTADEVKADWLWSRQHGKVWGAAANELAHWTFGEATTGSGLLDDSGNGNNLTSVSGSPTARYGKLPWPDGGSRRYAGLRINGKWAKTVLEPPPLSVATGLAPTPASARNLNAATARLGCDTSGSCLNGTIEKFEWWGRPAPSPDPVPDDPTRLLDLDFSEGAYAAAQDTPRFEVPTGASSANTWIWDMSEFSGKLVDRINAVELTASGTPRYQAWTGLWARGKGRRGIDFVKAGGPERIKTTDTSKASLNGATGVTLEFVGTNRTMASNNTVVDTRGIAGGSGYTLAWSNSSITLVCAVASATSARNCTITTANDTSPHHWACVATYGGSDWTFAMYQDGEAVSCSLGGSTTTNVIPNAQGLAIGEISDYTTDYGYTGTLYEVRIRNAADNAATVKAHYRQSVEQGTYWTDDANTVAHYAMNDYAPALTGLSDLSGNGNHLTTITGTPEGPALNVYNAPWPMGSGTNKRAIASTSTSDYFGIATTPAIPDNGQSFSWAAWVKTAANAAVGIYPVVSWTGGTHSQYFMSISGTTGAANCRWDTDTTFAQATSATVNNDNVWHLISCRARWSGTGYVTGISVDGGAFGETTEITGNVNQTNPFRVLQSDTAWHEMQVSGVMINKNYLLTDTDVAAMWKQGADPTGKLTYARADKMCVHADRHPIDGVRVKCYKANQVAHCWDHDANNEQLTGEIVSQQITNYAYYSEQLDQWSTKTGCTVTANAVESPDGMKTADAMVEDSSTGQHYAGATSASTSTGSARTCVFFKQGLRAWAMLAASDGTLSPYAFFDLATCSPGATYSACSNVTAMGVGGGWCRGCFSWTTTAGGAFAQYVYGATGDGTNSYTGSAGSTALYAWGYRTNIPAKPQPYCPTDGAATAACGNVTSNLVAAGHLSGWPRSQGVLFSVGIATADAVLPDLWNGSTNAGKHRMRPWNWGAAIWDSSGTLVQNVSGATPSTGTQRAQVMVFDSSTPFYSTTRRLYTFQQAESYAGPATTYGTDSGAWTPIAGTNAYVDTISSYILDGVTGGVWVWSER